MKTQYLEVPEGEEDEEEEEEETHELNFHPQKKVKK